MPSFNLPQFQCFVLCFFLCVYLVDRVANLKGKRYPKYPIKINFGNDKSRNSKKIDRDSVRGRDTMMIKLKNIAPARVICYFQVDFALCSTVNIFELRICVIPNLREGVAVSNEIGSNRRNWFSTNLSEIGEQNKEHTSQLRVRFHYS